MASALVYCQSGGGKTVNSTLVKGKKNLLLCTDNSHVVLNNFKRDNLDIEIVEHYIDRDNTGRVQKNFAQQFDESVDTGKYDNIIVDNISDLFDMAILEYDEQGKIKDPRQYYQIVYQDLKRLSRKAARQKTNVIFTAWTDIQPIMLADGTAANRTQPKLPNKILDNILGLTQIVAYINTYGEGTDKKWYYVLAGSQTMYAKDQLFCRKTCMPEDIFTGEGKK